MERGTPRADGRITISGPANELELRKVYNIFANVWEFS